MPPNAEADHGEGVGQRRVRARDAELRLHGGQHHETTTCPTPPMVISASRTAWRAAPRRSATRPRRATRGYSFPAAPDAGSAARNFSIDSPIREPRL